MEYTEPTEEQERLHVQEIKHRVREMHIAWKNAVKVRKATIEATEVAIEVAIEARNKAREAKKVWEEKCEKVYEMVSKPVGESH